MEIYHIGQVVKNWAYDMVFDQDVPSFIAESAVNEFLINVNWIEVVKDALLE
jgi:hypothetical protein